MEVLRKSISLSWWRPARNLRYRAYANQSEELEEEFDKVDVLPPKKGELRSDRKKFNEKIQLPDPRYKRMATNQDWLSVWPTAKMFNPNTVPLPIHMGYVETKSGTKPRPGKFANTELMKIPNFLHLAPPAIKRHCEVLKNFCTAWPSELKTDEDCENYFPITTVTKDYIQASPTIRDPRARIVHLQIKMSALDLDYHAKDKLKRLLGERYNSETDVITILGDRCPLRVQNAEYTKYLLTACYFEAWTVEPWESEKEQSDWEKYLWEKSPSKEALLKYYRDALPKVDGDDLLGKEEVEKYAESVTRLHDGKESEELLSEYRKSVEKLLFA